MNARRKSTTVKANKNGACVLVLGFLATIVFAFFNFTGFLSCIFLIFIGMAVTIFVVYLIEKNNVSKKPWHETYNKVDGEMIKSLMASRMYPKPFLDFVAIDFETANTQKHSACALAVVVVKGGSIVERRSWLINPGTKTFRFTDLHGITYKDIKDKPTWPEIWPEVEPYLRDQHLVAHNMEFDHGVLKALCEKHAIYPARYGVVCTLELSRNKLRLHSYRLNVVCQHLGIPLNHHDPMSDAEAAALIALRLA
jgi:DNA polymerase-3 subunit epsilon